MTEKILGICDDCLAHQKHHELDTEHEQFYCEHNQTWAIRARDGVSWLISWPISKAMYLHQQSNAHRIWKGLHWNTVEH